jgi:hypothetical protein
MPLPFVWSELVDGASLIVVVHDGSSRRKGDEYILTREEIEAYHRDGYLIAPGIVSEAELQAIEVPLSFF